MVNTAEKLNSRNESCLVCTLTPTAIVILLVMYISTATAVRSFSAMRRHGDNRALVGSGPCACPQGQNVGCRTHHSPVQLFSANIPPKSRYNRLVQVYYRSIISTYMSSWLSLLHFCDISTDGSLPPFVRDRGQVVDFFSMIRGAFFLFYFGFKMHQIANLYMPIALFLKMYPRPPLKCAFPRVFIPNYAPDKCSPSTSQLVDDAPLGGVDRYCGSDLEPSPSSPTHEIAVFSWIIFWYVIVSCNCCLSLYHTTCMYVYMPSSTTICVCFCTNMIE